MMIATEGDDETIPTVCEVPKLWTRTSCSKRSWCSVKPRKEKERKSSGNRQTSYISPSCTWASESQSPSEDGGFSLERANLNANCSARRSGSACLQSLHVFMQRFCPFAPVSRTPRSSCLNGWRSTKASSEYVRYRIYITVLVFQPAELGTLTRRDAGGWGGKQYSTLYSA